MFSFLSSALGDHKCPIKLKNSASSKLEDFKPIKSNQVTIYACGPTVYDHIHIGNLRAYLLPDLLHRLFLYCGYSVKLTINFTDFGHLSDDGDSGEDKIMKGMQKEGYPITLDAMREFATPYIESFKSDNIAFGNLPATNYTRASDYVREQIKLVETLEQKGYAYETSDGVYFDISKYPKYGQLGNVDIAKLKAGARVEVNAEKRHPADFALWKKSELGWKSRFGTGFPGWHIECTAMAFATLGKHIDIHTGGEDLQYTHHNAEIAQAECITNKPFVNYWLHNAHISIGGEKLAKSAGNGLRLGELVAHGFNPLDYRYWLLQSHYRSRANFTIEALKAAKQGLLRLRRFVYLELDNVKPTKINERYENQILKAMCDDLDTPKAISLIWDLVKDESVPAGEKLATIHAVDSLLSIGLSLTPEQGKAELGYVESEEIPKEILDLMTKRELARKDKDWDEADRIRKDLENQGYIIEDTTNGPQVSKNS